MRSLYKPAAVGLVVALVLIVLPVITLAQSTGHVTREVDNPGVCPSDIVTVTITPTGVLGFYAIQENLGTLKLIDHTADQHQEGIFVLLTPRPFTYRVQVPSTATEGQLFAVSGMFWDDPADKKEIGSTTLTVACVRVATPSPMPVLTPTPTSPKVSPTARPSSISTPTPTPTSIPVSPTTSSTPISTPTPTLESLFTATPTPPPVAANVTEPPVPTPAPQTPAGSAGSQQEAPPSGGASCNVPQHASAGLMDLTMPAFLLGLVGLGFRRRRR